MNLMRCHLCHKSVFVKFGKNCKICGMTLCDEGKDFCSKICRIKYIKLRGNVYYEKNNNINNRNALC